MRFITTPRFARDYARSAPEHRRLFQQALREHFLPAVRSGALRRDTTWPATLRIHKLKETSIYSMTWSFTSPDGRATFHVENRQRRQADARLEAHRQP
ncbi:hypothetical protein [Fodinicola feengrottensis]|uniref:hypothetical protein n=1 Tax=Fodinicola feengrottensis TaxID=435914 RepID=UPI0024431A9B|nr:hypothetical protein [Fodinicola feengrottensis]